MDDPRRNEPHYTSGRTKVGQYPARYCDATAEVDPVTKLMPGPLALYQDAADKPTALAQLLAIQNRISVWTNGGTRFFIIDETNGDVNAGHWGAVSDGYYDAATGAMHLTSNAPNAPAATDSQPAIQAMIDWMTYIHRRTPRDQIIHIPAGVFRLGKSLRLGYGQYTNATLVGAGKSYLFDQNGGTTLLCDFANQPGIAMTASLWGGVRSLALLGRLARHANKFHFDRKVQRVQVGQTLQEVAFLNLSDWADPAQPTTDPSRVGSPYAGIAIDPYNVDPKVIADGGNPLPESPYPNDHAPAWTASGTRGATYTPFLGTTAPTFEDVHISGFSVGIVMQPSHFDGNGDFLTMSRCHIGLCAIGVSIGNTQSRNVRLHNCNFGRLHTMLTTSMHGRRNGRLQGVVLDCSGSEMVQVVDLRNNSAVWGPVRFQSFYMENVWRIGDVYYGAQAGAELVFAESSFAFSMQNPGDDGQGVPKNILGTPPGMSAAGQGKVIFERCKLSNQPLLLPLNKTGVIVRDSQIQPDWYYRTPDPLLDWHWYASDSVTAPGWLRCAMNTLAGGVIVQDILPTHDQSITHTVIDLDTGARSDVISGPGATWTSHGRTASVYCTTLGSAFDRPHPNSMVVYPYDRASFTNNVYDAVLTPNHGFNPDTGIWKFRVGMSEEGLHLAGLAPGSVLLGDEGFIFFVQSATGSPYAYDVTAVLMNGYRVSSSGVREYFFKREPGQTNVRDIPDVTTGQVKAYSGRVYAPTVPTFFDVAASSNVLVNVQDGMGNNQATQFTVGSWLLNNRLIDDWQGGINATRVGVVGTKTLTVPQGAVGARTGKQIPLAVRSAP